MLLEPAYCVYQVKMPETNSKLYFIQYSDPSEFLGEPGDICAAELLQMLCDLKRSTKYGWKSIWDIFLECIFVLPGFPRRGGQPVSSFR